MAMPDHVSTRRALVENLKLEHEQAVKDYTQEVKGGEWDGVPVLTIPSVIEVVHRVFDAPVPPPGDHQGEVLTPGLVLVHVVCPNCSRVNAIPVALTAALTITSTGSELAVKSRSKGRFHMCDRPESDEASEADGLLLGLGRPPTDDDTDDGTGEPAEPEPGPEEPPTAPAEPPVEPPKRGRGKPAADPEAEL